MNSLGENQVLTKKFREYMKNFTEIFEYLRIFSKNTNRYEKINIILIRYQKTVKNERISLGPRKQNVFFGRQSSSDQEI